MVMMMMKLTADRLLLPSSSSAASLSTSIVSAFPLERQYPLMAGHSCMYDYRQGIQTASLFRQQKQQQQQRPHPRLAVAKLHLQQPVLRPESNKKEATGRVTGAALLFAGTAVGAGMLALPAETAAAGYLPTVGSLLACWAFTYTTSLVTLEATWRVSVGTSRDTQNTENDDDSNTAAAAASAGFLSISQTTLGPVGTVATVVLFWFLLTSIIVAYTAQGGALLVQAVQELGPAAARSVQIPVAAGSTLFLTVFAALAVGGTQRVDWVNRLLVAGLIASFGILVAVGVPQISVAELLQRADWRAVDSKVLSVGILSFGAQNVVPTLLQYLGRDPVRTRRAILLGSLIPLVMYCMWEAVFLGLVPYDAVDAGALGNGGSSNDDKMQIVTALGGSGGAMVKDLVAVFSACAIGSSMAGASVSLVDFFQDGIVSSSSAVLWPSNKTESSPLGGRVVVAVLALGPPLALACAFPGVFLSALEYAGLLGGVSLYGLLPALAVIKLRARDESSGDAGDVDGAPIDDGVMPGQLVGGSAALYAIIGVSLALVLPELVQLGEIAIGAATAAAIANY